MSLDATDRRLAESFKVAMQMRAEMRQAGASEREMRDALERILRANWPHVEDERDWPHHMREPRCIHCDGYGLVIKHVKNRLGCWVEEGTPCTCYKGTRYLEKPKQDADFTQAGKTTTKPKGFTRWNG